MKKDKTPSKQIITRTPLPNSKNIYSWHFISGHPGTNEGNYIKRFQTLHKRY